MTVGWFRFDQPNNCEVANIMRPHNERLAPDANRIFPAALLA